MVEHVMVLGCCTFFINLMAITKITAILLRRLFIELKAVVTTNLEGFLISAGY